MEIVDYARPAMMAEKALKDMHNAMLEHKYDSALAFALQAIVESKIAYNAIKHEKETRNAMAKKSGS